ncbi:hypothetical protein VPH35_010600 [Triticum aestivum]
MEVARVAPWRTRKKTRAAARNATLPEDVVLEILVRVADVAALFRCAVACKRWWDLVSDAAFLRRRWPLDTPSLIGFFARQRRYRARARAAASVPYPAAGARRAPALVPAPGCPLGPLLDDAVPLASRDGLLLVRLADAPAGHVDADARLAVCNLIAGTCDVLPPLRCSFSFRINSCVVQTFADGCCSAFFRVLVLVLDSDTLSYSLCAFSSTEPSWSPPIECFSSAEIGVVDGGGAIVHRGTAHWLVTDTSNNLHTLEASDDVLLNETPIPPPGDHDFILHRTPCLNVAIDGALSLLRLCKDCLWLEVWARPDEERSGDGVPAEWLQTKAIQLKRPKNKEEIEKVQRLCLDERSGALFVEDNLESMYTVDLETGEMDEVTDQFWRLKSQTAVPFQMDWPAFFKSRLGGNRRNQVININMALFEEWIYKR